MKRRGTGLEEVCFFGGIGEVYLSEMLAHSAKGD